MKENRGAIVDSLCILNSYTCATLVANAAGKDDAGAAFVFDTGGGFTKANVVYDVAYMASHATHDAILIAIQGAAASTFTTCVELNSIRLGTAAAGTAGRLGGNVGVAVPAGRYVQSVNNKFGDSVYRYMRAYIKSVGGTFGTGIKVGIMLTSE
jgi:hypothetical protein